MITKVFQAVRKSIMNLFTEATLIGSEESWAEQFSLLQSQYCRAVKMAAHGPDGSRASHTHPDSAKAKNIAKHHDTSRYPIDFDTCAILHELQIRAGFCKELVILHSFFPFLKVLRILVCCLMGKLLPREGEKISSMYLLSLFP